jgi:hypothetical protein
VAFFSNYLLSGDLVGRVHYISTIMAFLQSHGGDLVVCVHYIFHYYGFLQLHIGDLVVGFII